LVTYIEWIELQSFFSGYLFVYATFYMIASNYHTSNVVKNKVLPNLPVAYAVVGTLYLGLQLKNAYISHLNYFTTYVQFPYLKIWGILSIFFWLPLLHRKGLFSVLHNMVFFILILNSSFLQFWFPSNGDRLATNNAWIYTASIIINLVALVFTIFISSLISRFKRP
jgi:hypothetical protein